MSKNLSAIVAHVALLLAVVIVIGILGSFRTGTSAGAEKFTGELEENATIRVLENDTAIKQGYLAEPIAVMLYSRYSSLNAPMSSAR